MRRCWRKISLACRQTIKSSQFAIPNSTKRPKCWRKRAWIWLVFRNGKIFGSFDWKRLAGLDRCRAGSDRLHADWSVPAELYSMQFKLTIQIDPISSLETSALSSTECSRYWSSSARLSERQSMWHGVRFPVMFLRFLIDWPLFVLFPHCSVSTVGRSMADPNCILVEDTAQVASNEDQPPVKGKRERQLIFPASNMLRWN